MSPVFMLSNKECDDYFGTMPKSNLVLQKSFKYLLSISVTVSACGLLSADGACGCMGCFQACILVEFK